ncbi:hypothetical protein MGN70_009121 [Eutypa lata]|uniref:Uncharacterized protein n=1 Tax=Eutypa lata (strain UCR-EL1) TaxID=1287681 RepID=M7SEC5_EUTLA|nr:hypothetical protein UCREL1_10509 [Eutypa lata UCREL1]KAI1249508.1 hypothetical protein MGN70_009121 [Eutypa lata]
MTGTEGKTRFATLLHLLPNITIPKSNRPDPEQITPSRVVNFFVFLKKHGRAPPSIPKAERPVDRIEPTDVDANVEPAKTALVQSFISSREDVPAAPTTDLDGNGNGDDDDDGDDDLPTLEFDQRDWRELDRKKRELEDAKVKHGYWISLLKDDPRNPETLKSCRHWRRVREEIGEVLRLIPERLRIRRQFREDFNPKWVE